MEEDVEGWKRPHITFAGCSVLLQTLLDQTALEDPEA